MSGLVKERKYKFNSTVRLPDMDEIVEAASDFSAPTDKKIVIGNPSTKQILKESTTSVPYSKEQLEMQKLGLEVVDAEKKRAKEKELARAEELRRLCKEREALAMKKKAEEEAKAAGIKVVEDKPSEEPVMDSAETESVQDISAIAENPFDEKKTAPKEKAEKEEFKETILKDDYTDEMEFLEDSSESVDDDFLDF